MVQDEFRGSCSAPGRRPVGSDYGPGCQRVPRTQGEPGESYLSAVGLLRKLWLDRNDREAKFSVRDGQVAEWSALRRIKLPLDRTVLDFEREPNEIFPGSFWLPLLSRKENRWDGTRAFALKQVDYVCRRNKLTPGRDEKSTAVDLCNRRFCPSSFQTGDRRHGVLHRLYCGNKGILRNPIAVAWSLSDRRRRGK